MDWKTRIEGHPELMDSNSAALLVRLIRPVVDISYFILCSLL